MHVKIKLIIFFKLLIIHVVHVYVNLFLMKESDEQLNIVDS